MAAAMSIGRFEIRGELGHGAQSVVYLAWDPQLQREVAIKTLHFEQPDPARNAELLDEARTTGRFRHPNVVPIFDAGEQDGNPFLVFERVEGRSLAAQLKEDGPLPPAKAASLMHAVADALSQAHAQGIIHRDLKPSNILIDARDGSARVMDFGIATHLSDSGAATVKGLVGTPLYMAPEYVRLQRITPQIDVFAAGLVLLEMLTGKRAIQGATLEAILHRVSTEQVQLPTEPLIDARLGGIALRACALDPSLRYANAADLRDALADYLGDAGVDQPDGGTAATHKETLEFLLRRMRHKADFPALANSVSAINRLTESAAGNANALADVLLKDYALTNKILRLVNSAHYRQAGGGHISTVSRAVIVLGFDTIRTLAMTVLLFEHLQNKSNAHELKEAFLRANLAAMLARKSCHIRLLRQHGEEAYICALFHELGHLLVKFYFPEEAEEIRKLMEFKKLSLRAASIQVLGLSCTELGIGIAGNWGFPREIVESMRELPVGVVRKPHTTNDALRIVASFANETCALLSSVPVEECGRIAVRVAQRYGACLDMDGRRLQSAMHQALKDLAEIAAILQLNPRQSNFVKLATNFAGSTVPPEDADASPANRMANQFAHTLLEQSSDGRSHGQNRVHGLPDDAQSILASGIQDISNSLVDDFALNDILRIVLETMYRGMGFCHVLLSLRDAHNGVMTARLGLGPEVDALMKQFHFTFTDQLHDVFELACGKGLDIIIHDIDDPKIADKVPLWYRSKIPAKTFVLLPLNIKGRSVALIYCDREKADSIAIPDKELALLKTLRNQALLAIKQAA